MKARTRNGSPTVVIGAGPHGLSAVAHLRAAGVPVRAFGEPMGFWRQTMPAGMLLRSSPRASSISDPDGALSLSRWRSAVGRELGKLIAIGDFIDYGLWFAQRAVPDLDPRQVRLVERAPGEGFLLTLADGERIAAGRVVVAVGLGSFPHIPDVFAGLPRTLVSHTCHTPGLERLRGRSVAVLGSGQSALESAALLHEVGARVEVLARSPAIFWLGGYGWGGADGRPTLPPPPASGSSTRPSWRARHGLYWRGAPTEVGGRFESWLGAAPDACRMLPAAIRAPFSYSCARPAGGWWLPERLREVPITLGRTVVRAQAAGEQLTLELDDGSERAVDHALLGTGYRIDVSRFPFLAPGLLAELRTRRGSPVLRWGLESSVRGLHFTGALATESFGPAMRFVVGTAYTGPAVAQGATGRRRPLLRWAF
jgi:cation diffusion facilitator CzcD-associated flavoprotein CzcO